MVVLTLAAAPLGRDEGVVCCLHPVSEQADKLKQSTEEPSKVCTFGLGETWDARTSHRLAHNGHGFCLPSPNLSRTKAFLDTRFASFFFHSLRASASSSKHWAPGKRSTHQSVRVTMIRSATPRPLNPDMTTSGPAGRLFVQTTRRRENPCSADLKTMSCVQHEVTGKHFRAVV